MIQYTILQLDSVRERGALINHFIDVADKCVELHNFWYARLCLTHFPTLTSNGELVV